MHYPFYPILCFWPNRRKCLSQKLRLQVGPWYVLVSRLRMLPRLAQAYVRTSWEADKANAD